MEAGTKETPVLPLVPLSACLEAFAAPQARMSKVVGLVSRSCVRLGMRAGECLSGLCCCPPRTRPRALPAEQVLPDYASAAAGGQRVEASVTHRMSSFPPYLLVQLKRWVCVGIREGGLPSSVVV